MVSSSKTNKICFVSVHFGVLQLAKEEKRRLKKEAKAEQRDRRDRVKPEDFFVEEMPFKSVTA